MIHSRIALILNLVVLPLTAGFAPLATTAPSFHADRTRALQSFEIATVASTTSAVQGVSAAMGVSAAATSAAAQQASASAMAAINTFFQTQPYLAAFLTCSVKASAADLLAQTQEDHSEEPTDIYQASSIQQQPLQQQQQQTQQLLQSQSQSNPPLDVSRNMGFLLYGGLYSGIAQNYLYNVIYPAVIGTDDSWETILKQVVADNLISAPLLCLPIAYIFKTAFTSEGDIGWETLKEGTEKYVNDVTNKGLLLKYWTLWIPVQFLTFGVVPAHFRVAFVAAISFFWICILSTIAASEDEQVVAPAGGQEATAAAGAATLD